MRPWPLLMMLWFFPAYAQPCGGLPPVMSVESILAVSRCVAPTIGGPGVRHERFAGPTAPNSALFVLRRPSESQWEAELNVELMNQPTLKDPLEATRMRERIAGCFIEAAPYLRGPDGQSLRLRLHDPASPAADGLVPPLIPITLLPRMQRGDAQNFAVDFDCGTIIHEFMHHLGLCDEYRERGDFASSGVCRVVVPMGSFMGPDMRDVYDSTVGAAMTCDLSGYPRWRDLPRDELNLHFRKGFDDLMYEEPFLSLSKTHCSFTVQSPRTLSPEAPALVREIPRGLDVVYLDADLGFDGGRPRQVRQICQCPEGAVECAAAMEQLRLQAELRYSVTGLLNRCPKNVISKREFREPTDPVGITFEGSIARVVNQPAGRGLLHPAHFDRIIRGSCQASAQQTAYDGCARFAYQWSEPAPRPEGCGVVPKICADPARMLGVPPQLR